MRKLRPVHRMNQRLVRCIDCGSSSAATRCPADATSDWYLGYLIQIAAKVEVLLESL